LLNNVSQIFPGQNLLLKTIKLTLTFKQPWDYI